MPRHKHLGKVFSTKTTSGGCDEAFSVCRRYLLSRRCRRITKLCHEHALESIVKPAGAKGHHCSACRLYLLRPVAASAYACLAKAQGKIQRVVLLAPSHRAFFEGMATTTASAYQTPLGTIPIENTAYLQRIAERERRSGNRTPAYFCARSAQSKARAELAHR